MVVCFIDIADGCLLRCFGVGWWGGVGICAVLGRKSAFTIFLWIALDIELRSLVGEKVFQYHLDFVYGKKLDLQHVIICRLRDAQGYCTDSECIQDLPGPQGVGLGGNNLIMIGLIWSMIALAMFFLRPKSLRSNPSSTGKPGPSSSREDDNYPPAPDVQ
ncbi:unnamed protein product [Dracunculus medinensis]|uniref:Small integral membrane protein 14 n=1 Tax=Dracunculus medinensis TaxID=318479 RepID=A0A0N4UIY3_DRAME|nr:unnamed protein product [Dracunculus medinensis]